MSLVEFWCGRRQFMRVEADECIGGHDVERVQMDKLLRDPAHAYYYLQ